MRVSNPKINKEAIKTLVVAYGQREAARKAGLNVNTVMAWARRYGWQQALPETSHAICTQSPADALGTTIAQNGSETKLGLSEYAKKQAQHLASKGKLKDSSHFRNLASGSATVHGWNEQGQAKQFSLNVLNLGDLQIGRLSADATAHTDKLVEGMETDKPTG